MFVVVYTFVIVFLSYIVIVLLLLLLVNIIISTFTKTLSHFTAIDLLLFNSKIQPVPMCSTIKARSDHCIIKYFHLSYDQCQLYYPELGATMFIDMKNTGPKEILHILFSSNGGE